MLRRFTLNDEAFFLKRFNSNDLYINCQIGHETYGHKKRSTAVLQPLLTLKSNTMKNTVQRYGLSGNMQVFQ